MNYILGTSIWIPIGCFGENLQLTELLETSVNICILLQDDRSEDVVTVKSAMLVFFFFFFCDQSFQALGMDSALTDKLELEVGNLQTH